MLFQQGVTSEGQDIVKGITQAKTVVKFRVAKVAKDAILRLAPDRAAHLIRRPAKRGEVAKAFGFAIEDLGKYQASLLASLLATLRLASRSYILASLVDGIRVDA